MLRKMMNLCGALLLCTGLLTAAACGSEDGDGSGDNNGTNNGTPSNNDPNNGDPNNGDPNNGDPNNGDPNNGDTNNGDPNTCTPACGPGETCVNGACVASGEPPCRNVGEVCNENTPPSSTLVCLTGGDSRNPQDATCHTLCDPALEDVDCPAGSFCVELQNGGGACLRSNCTSPLRSEEECGDVGQNGGTCIIARNDSFYCIDAGPLAEDADCVEPSEENPDVESCGAGLTCFNGKCKPFCEAGDDSACNSGEACLPALTSEDFGICDVSCPGFAATDECGEGKGCFPLTADLGFCTEVGDVPVGEMCGEGMECGQLSVCTRLFAEDPALCYGLCNRSEGLGDESCDEGQICLDLNDVVGACFPGCTPFAEENGCEEAGRGTCIPIEAQDRGLCFDSGDVADGGRCDLVDGSVLGSCAPGLVCAPDFDEDVVNGEATKGDCTTMCRTFASVNDYESGCEANEVCSIFGTEWGACEPLAGAPLNNGDACPTAGEWCSDDNICLQVDQQGNNLCIALCRLGTNDDCPSGQACMGGLLQSDALGVCIAR